MCISTLMHSAADHSRPTTTTASRIWWISPYWERDKEANIIWQDVRQIVVEDQNQDRAKDWTLKDTSACRHQGWINLCDAHRKCTVGQNWPTNLPTTAKPSIRWQQLMNNMQIASSFQWVLSRLHRTKYKRDNPPYIVQARPPALKMACKTACRAQFSTLWQVEIVIWTALSC